MTTSCCRCDAAATTTVYGICVHEHYDEAHHCDRHAKGVVLDSIAGRLSCKPCICGPEPHKCQIKIQRKAITP